MKKNVKQINESQLKAIVAESVKNILQEEYDWFGENKSPSPLEEDFEHEFTTLIDLNQAMFLEYGYTKESFKAWCHEMVDSVL